MKFILFFFFFHSALRTPYSSFSEQLKNVFLANKRRSDYLMYATYTDSNLKGNLSKGQLM